jgi:hypothetical protein
MFSIWFVFGYLDLYLYFDLLLFWILDLKHALKPAKKWPKPVQNGPKTQIAKAVIQLPVI